MSGELSALRFLVVDDNEHLQTILATVLSAAGGRQCRREANGVEALRVVQEWRPDVALVDYHMTPMDGLAFTRAVRASNDDTRFLPIIMVTGHSDQARIVAARDAGVTEVVAKPIVPAVLFDRLRSVIYKPRAFVSAADYIGPDRRRHLAATYAGPWRRSTDR